MLAESVLAASNDAAAALQEAGVPTEALAAFAPERRVALVRRRAKMRPLGEVWRLGTLLLSPGTNGGAPELFVAGRTTRSAVRPHPSNQSVSREERRDIAATAFLSGYAEGTVVHFDAVAVPLDDAGLLALDPSQPLGVVDGEIRVRWRAGAPLAGAQLLSAYLNERVDLLVNPPQGAS